MESRNISSQEIELNPSCSGQSNFNWPANGAWYENAESGCILALFRVPSRIHPLRRADAKSGKVVRSSAQLRAARVNGRIMIYTNSSKNFL